MNGRNEWLAVEKMSTVCEEIFNVCVGKEMLKKIIICYARNEYIMRKIN